jgi:hypothetical protein
MYILKIAIYTYIHVFKPDMYSKQQIKNKRERERRAEDI